MKILHTSDWHLGCQLYGFDRLEEQAAMLDTIIDIAGREKPDAFIVSGDVFDSTQPPNRAYRLFVDKMEGLRRLCPETVIVIIAGNHDSATRHELFRTPWLRDNIHLVGYADAAEPDKLSIHIPGKGTVAAVPYVHPRFMADDYFTAAVERAAAATPDGLPVVLMAHLALADSEADIGTAVGHIDCLPPKVLGDGYDYAALGHIHRRYIAAGAPKARFCGTPLMVSFDEPGEHGVEIVGIASRGAVPEVRHVEIPACRPLLTIPETAADFEECLKVLAAFPDDIPAYLRLHVRAAGISSDAPFRARKALDGKQAVFCAFKFAEEESERSDLRRNIAVDDFLNISPEEVARMYAAGRGIEFDDELAGLFAEAVAQSESDERS